MQFFASPVPQHVIGFHIGMAIRWVWCSRVCDLSKLSILNRLDIFSTSHRINFLCFTLINIHFKFYIFSCPCSQRVINRSFCRPLRLEQTHNHTCGSTVSNHFQPAVYQLCWKWQWLIVHFRWTHHFDGELRAHLLLNSKLCAFNNFH